MRTLILSTLSVSLLSLAIGCGPGTQTTNDPPANNNDSHPHSHGDELFWQTENLAHEDVTISLGHHGTDVYSAHDTEPAVMIVRDGEPVGDAKVFVTMLSADNEPIGEEQSTEYEPTTEEEPGHYAQAIFKVPAKVESITLRYRIEFSGDQPEFTKDVPIAVESH